MGHETSETEIRALIEDWAKALQNQDLEAVIAHHTCDMLMFDVPPPNELRGVDAYRESWEPFFEHFEKSGIFEIEIFDVTAGTDVAYATALLRCGTEGGIEEGQENAPTPDRLPRKEQGRWMIAHEHYSFPAKTE